MDVNEEGMRPIYRRWWQHDVHYQGSFLVDGWNVEIWKWRDGNKVVTVVAFKFGVRTPGSGIMLAMSLCSLNSAYPNFVPSWTPPSSFVFSTDLVHRLPRVAYGTPQNWRMPLGYCHPSSLPKPSMVNAHLPLGVRGDIVSRRHARQKLRRALRRPRHIEY